MQWSDLLGHEQQRIWFQTALATGRLATSFLFVGPDGIGKRSFARLLAKSLLCRHTSPIALSCCGSCEDCVQVDASTHPDLIEVAKPPDKASLPLELLIGPPENRMREGLCYEISLRPYSGRRKIAILDDADTLFAESANCLLKTLEEPPLDSLLVLIGTSLQRQLPTIRSRCQAILFRPLSDEHLAILIRSKLLSGDADHARGQMSDEQISTLVSQSEGSLARAKTIADRELQEFRNSLCTLLAADAIPISELIKDFSAVVDAAGKEGRVKRDRMKLLFHAAAAYYRDLCLTHYREGASRNALKTATRCWNRCLIAAEQVDRNANQAALIEAWTTDMARLKFEV
jgi:DNA polymerase-3 subunit delta'